MYDSLQLRPHECSLMFPGFSNVYMSFVSFAGEHFVGVSLVSSQIKSLINLFEMSVKPYLDPLH